jgi:hypothetical protein
MCDSLYLDFGVGLGAVLVLLCLGELGTELDTALFVYRFRALHVLLAELRFHSLDIAVGIEFLLPLFVEMDRATTILEVIDVCLKHTID